MRIFLLPLILLCLIPASAQAWWNNDWDFRKEFTFDTSATGLPITNTVNDATVLLRLHLGNFTYFTDTLPNGADLRFVAGDDITPLKHHIEYYDPTQQIGLIWVKIPRLVPGTNLDKIYMYYGNATAVKGDDTAGTYSVDDVLVYHFDGVPGDKTAYNNQPQTNSSLESPATAIGSGVEFAGTQNIVIPSSPSLRLLPDPGATVSLWMQMDVEQSDAAVLNYIDDNGASLSLKIAGNIPYLQYISATGESVTTSTEIEGLALEAWNNIAFTISEENFALYINGVEVTTLEASIEEIGGVISLGAWADESLGFVGKIDELRIAKKPISADAILLAYNNQGPNDILLRAGADGQQEGAGEEHNYIAFSLSKLTLEGKITTGILTLMLVFATMIMFAKGAFLSGVRKANGVFQHRYTNKDTDKDVTSKLSLQSIQEKVNPRDKKLKKSTLNRVFVVGMNELESRVSSSTAGAANAQLLSTNAVNAIRAGMDTAMLRENQRLQKQMVLLTIAISGGPFIGLFGTVMGVMITFAEVALAGNVDVNAIAPGISAALVATVAGLAVAIPCLFGYNYLAAQIKEVSADMRVFLDEFQARVAEEYGE